MKKHAALYTLPLLLIIGYPGQTQQQWNIQLPRDHFNFMAVNDMGQKGVSEQQGILKGMGKAAETNTIRLIALGGNRLHSKEVQNGRDPEWKARFEELYTPAPLRTIPWYVIPGSHAYPEGLHALDGCVTLPSRWNAGARYFALEQPLRGSETCLLVFIDTASLIDRYRIPAYSDPGTQDIQEQLTWLEQTLAHSKARWKIVMGYHSIFGDTGPEDREGLDMRKRVAPILERQGADLYIGGRLHNFQHIRRRNTTVEYAGNASASRSRTAGSVEGTIFCSPGPGFSVVSVSVERIAFYMINHAGETLHIFVIPDVR